MKLNNRLTAIAELVEKNSNVMDVGCDHGLLGIYLAKSDKNITVLSSDNKEGPLNQAKINTKEYKLEDKIRLKLGQGIEPIEDDIDTVVISGMGGANIIGILKYSTQLQKNIETLILSPNNDQPRVRKEISQLGYYLETEKLIKENNIIYNIMRFKKGKKRLEKSEIILGSIELTHDKLFDLQNQTELKKLNTVLKAVPKKYLLMKLRIKKEIKIREKYLKR